VRRFFWILSLVLGFLQAWASRSTISSDAVSYFDIGNLIWHGHWSSAVNGLWNPLYSVILGVTEGLLHPSIHWAYPLVHLILFVFFLFALWSYDVLLQQLIQLRQETEVNEEISIPVWVWLCIGYTLFLWSSLRFIKVSETNPDMLVAACFYLACGMLVKIRRGSASSSVYLIFGFALALGYLTKSIMFPVSLCCLAVALVIGRAQRSRVWIAVAFFLALAGPYIAALSLAKGRITFGDSGKYNYAVYVDNVPPFHWQGPESDGNDDGYPLHPTRRIVLHPATFEFGSPVAGTYPFWTDPTYWYEGVHSRFHLGRAVRNELNLLGIEALLLTDLHGSIIASIFVLLYTSGRKWSVLRDLGAYWFLIVPCATILILYALIHVEPRYLGPFFAVMLLSTFFAVRLPASYVSRLLYSAVAVLMLLMFFFPLASPSLNVRGFVRDVLGHSQADPNSPEEVAEAMYQLGLRPGDHIASLQRSDFGMSTWACLARVQIVAEVLYWPYGPELHFQASAENDFWRMDSATQERVIHALAGTGVTFIVSQLAPPVPDVPGWRRVGNTQYFAYQLYPAGGHDVSSMRPIDVGREKISRDQRLN
jgi:hypothetical protein